MSFLSVRGLARRAVYVPVGADPGGTDGRAPGPRVDVRHRHPWSPPRLPHRPAAARGRLHRAADLVPGDRRRCRERYRVVTLDQRWHGRGIQSEEFSLHDCADDAAALLDVLGIEQAIVVGFSMGSIVAQRVWRQHPDAGRRAGAVRDDRPVPAIAVRAGVPPGHGARDGRRPRRLPVAYGGARDAHGRRGPRPRPRRHPRLGAARVPQHQPLGGRPGRGRAGPAPLPPVAVPDRRPDRGRGHQPRPGDPAPSASSTLARRIPGATIHDIDAGHAACVLESEVFVPAFVEAVATVNARRRDFSR